MNRALRLTVALVSLVVLRVTPALRADQAAAPAPTVRTVELAENLFELTALSLPVEAKILALRGPDGTLVVDSGLAAAAEAELQELNRLSAGTVRFLVNTHLHDDHIGGNAVLGPAATVIAHDNVRRRLTNGAALLFPRPKGTLPSITFDHALTLHINGEEVRLLHVAPAHTDGDVLVHFVHAGVVAVGDLIFADKFPYVAIPQGGSVQGYLDSLDVLASAFPAGTRFVAAHGPIYTAEQVRAYRGQLVAMRERVRQGLSAGKAAQQLKAEKVLEPWATWADSYVSADRFVDTLVAAETPSPDAGKPSVLDQIVPALLNGESGEAGVKLYRALKAQQPPAYSFDEGEVNRLGYGLLAQKRVEDALAIFRLNVEEHPDSANVYDSLAEGYMTAGQRDLAIRNYQRSLELDPSNRNATDMIKRLEKP